MFSAIALTELPLPPVGRRAGLLASVLAHLIFFAAVALPHHRQTAHGETISVDLVPSTQAPSALQEPMPEAAASEAAPKPEAPAADNQQNVARIAPPPAVEQKPAEAQASARPAAASARQAPPQAPPRALPITPPSQTQPEIRTALPLPTSPQGEVQAAPTPPHLADSPAEQHERLTALLNLDAPATKDSSNSSDKKADDKSEAEKPYLAAFKEHLRTCWTPPEGQSTGRLRTIFRIALSRDGALVAAPDPVAIEGVASPLAPALVQGARRALSQCQPYTMLPAKDYKDWRMLDVYFTPDRLDVATVSSGAQKSSSR